MVDILIVALLWFGAIGFGIMAGIYFTFSVFAMKSFAAIQPAAGISAMQSINEVIVKSAFLPLFFTTSLAALIAVVVSVVNTSISGSIWMGLGGGIYFVGMFLCTIIFNVPLNNKLAAVDPDSPEGEEVWHMYLRVWTRWNHVRTIACTIACALFIRAI